MKRFLTVLAATAAAAAPAAALSLPAGADQSKPPAPDALDAKFVTCLRDHGIGIPAGTRGDAIKQWIDAQGAGAVTESTLKACKSEAGGDVSPAEAVGCLRSHGLTPPATLDELKPWMARQSETDAGGAALRACGFGAPTEKAPAGGAEKRAAPCGGDAKPDSAPAGGA